VTHTSGHASTTVGPMIAFMQKDAT
jgi:hypothetical protein